MAIRTLMACLVVILFANLVAPVGAVAADLPQEIGQLKAAIQARIDAIGTPADKAEKKEGKKLGKAIPFIDAWKGNNDLADFSTLYKAAKLIYKSKTQDGTIREEVIDVIQCLFDLVKTEQARAQAIVDRLFLDKYKIKVGNVIDKAESVLGVGLSLLDTDYAKACKSAVKAWKNCGKAILKGEKFEDKEVGGGGGNVPDSLSHAQAFFGGFYLYNNSTKWYFIRDVRFTGEWRESPSGDSIATVNNASLAAFRPDLFVIQTFPGGGVDGQAMIHKMYPGDQYPTQHDLGSYVAEYRYEKLDQTKQVYFEGTIVLVISNQPKPGHKNEKTFNYVITDYTPRVL